MSEEFPALRGPAPDRGGRKRPPRKSPLPKMMRPPPQTIAQRASGQAPSGRKSPSSEKTERSIATRNTPTDIYVALYYDITQALRDLNVPASPKPYKVSGFIFGGAPRDQLAGQLPEDIDLTINGAAASDRPRAIASLARRLENARGAGKVAIIETPQLGGYAKYQLELHHVRLPRPIKIDVVFDLQPVLDFDVNGMIFTVDGERRLLRIVANPVFRGLPVDWGRLPSLIEHREFNIVPGPHLDDSRLREIIRLRAAKMRRRGWTGLNLPSDW